MDERYYLVKAQEAEAVADASESPRGRRQWERIAEECRRLANAIAQERRERLGDVSTGATAAD